MDLPVKPELHNPAFLSFWWLLLDAGSLFPCQLFILANQRLDTMQMVITFCHTESMSSFFFGSKFFVSFSILDAPPHPPPQICSRWCKLFQKHKRKMPSFYHIPWPLPQTRLAVKSWYEKCFIESCFNSRIMGQEDGESCKSFSVMHPPSSIFQAHSRPRSCVTLCLDRWSCHYSRCLQFHVLTCQQSWWLLEIPTNASAREK